jgi:predicted protein tyrosine phosphatase
MSDISCHPTILPLGYSEAAMFLRCPEGARVQAIISIHGKHEYGVESIIMHRLDLEFDDIPSPDLTDPIAAYHARMRAQARAADGLTTDSPTLDHARAILVFAESIKHLDGILLCHCAGGISRSPAAALLCLAQRTAPGEEEYCVQALASVRRGVAPHDDLVRFSDELLMRRGRLVAAVNKVLYGKIDP